MDSPPRAERDRRTRRQGIGRFAPTDANAMTGDPEDTLAHLMLLATGALELSMAYVAVSDGESLVFVAHDGLPPEVAGRHQMSATGSLSRRALDQRAPALANAADELKGSPERNVLRLAAHIAIPLEMPDGDLIGTLCAGTTGDHNWTDRDVELLTHIAAAATLVLRNRDAIHRTEATADLLRRMREPIAELTDHMRTLTALVEDSDDGRIRRFAALAAQRVKVVDELMGEVNAATRRAQELPPGSARRADLLEVVQRSLASARAASGTKHAYIDTPAEEVTVAGDPVEIEQSLTALLVSLMHYAGADDPIHLRLATASLPFGLGQNVNVARLDVLKLGPAVPTTELTRTVVRFRVGVSPQFSRLRMRGGTTSAASGVIRGRASAGRTAFRITLPRFDGEPQSS
ncbi:MAG: GAF domain-containing protein [Chloroflexi bacterium]|nr:GAF domain-containing protein [Chloroflexota bacterium]